MQFQHLMTLAQLDYLNIQIQREQTKCRSSIAELSNSTTANPAFRIHAEQCARS